MKPVILFVARIYETAAKKDRFLKYLQKAGYEIHVAAFKRKKSLGNLDFPFYRIAESPFDNVSSCIIPEKITNVEKDLDVIIRKIHPRLILNYGNNYMYFSTKIAEKHHLPIISMMRGFRDRLSFIVRNERNPLNEAFLKNILHYHKHILVVQNSRDNQLLIQKKYIPRNRIVLIKSSGVDAEKFRYHPEPLTKAINVRFVSRMLWDKGVEEFVNAAYLLKQKYPHANFELIGDIGTFSTSLLQKQLEHWNTSHFVQWKGVKKNMSNVYRTSHVIVLPSYYAEGIPRVLIEAGLCGRPIVTTNEGGCADVVLNGKNGFAVAPRDCIALAAAIEKLIINTKQRMAMGKQAVILAQPFTTQNVARQYLSLIGSTLKKYDHA